MHVIDKRLNALGLVLPAPPQPAGQYCATQQSDGLLFVSGQFPLRDGELLYCGSVGRELSLAQGRAAASLAGLNVLAQLRAVTANWQHLAAIVRVDGYVSSVPGFYAQPQVLDGASQLFADVLGECAGHARTAFSVSQLPLNAAVELVVIASLTTAMETD